MADSLDDFFAKKDKKRKNKSQTAALSAGALVRELEVGAKQSEYSARRDGTKTSTAMELLGLDANDNDWKDFEEVEKRDYTGLKVKEMSIQDQDDEQRRITEQSEQVPETVPWKSKEDTVAAIISARNESNQLANDLAEQQQDSASDPTNPAKPSSEEVSVAAALSTVAAAPATAAAAVAAALSQPATATIPASTDAKALAKTDNTDSDASNAAASSSTKAGPEGKPKTVAEVAAAVVKDEQKEAGSSSADATSKDGDSKPAASAKKVYVPPHERLEKEVRVLEPIRLSKAIRSSSSRGGAKIDIESTKDFPSLG